MAKDKDDILSPDVDDDEFGGLIRVKTVQSPAPAQQSEEAVKKAVKPPDTAGGDTPAPKTPEGHHGASTGVQRASEPKAAGKAKVARKAEKPKTTLTRREKAIRTILRRAGKEEMPELDELMKGKRGEKVAVKDIAIFIGEADGELMSELVAECPLKNVVNLSAEVQEARVLYVGAQIVKAGRMYLPIQVVRVNDELQCTSGRHRLAFVALAYGPNVKIPVHVEDMTLNEARDAVVVANEARPTKALERAEHAVLQAVGGDVDAEQDELYAKTVKTRASAKKYCVYSVIKRKYPIKLGFKVSQTSSRRDGGLTTITNVENFWGAAMDWAHDMERKKFDALLKESVRFLNALAEAFQKQPGFDADHHMASMTMVAMGKYYHNYAEITGKSATDMVDDIAKHVITMGEVGRQKSEKTYKALSEALKSK